MNFLIVLIALSLFPTSSVAESSISASLQLSGDIAARHHSDRKGGTKCGGGAGRVYRDDTRNYTSPLILNTATHATAEAILHVEPHTSPRYLVRLEASVSRARKLTTFHVNVSEASQKHGEFHWGHKCEHNHFNEDLQSAGYGGQVTFRYEVPADVWAVVIKKSSNNAVFLNSSERPLTNVLLHALGDGQEVLWVKPGSMVELTFDLNADANLIRPPAGYEFSVEPIGDQLNTSEAKTVLSADGFTQVVDALNGGKKLESALPEAQNFVLYALSLLRSRPAALSAMRELPLERLRWLTDNLFALTLANLDLKQPDLEMNVKAAAALLSYEVASLAVEEMAPYCEMRYVEAPITGQRVPVLGARYAQYLLENLSAHLSPNIFSAHRAFVDQLKLLQAEGYDYGAVGGHEEIRQRVARAFRLLRADSAVRQQPFRQARQDLAEYFTIFKPTQFDAESPSALLGKLDFLAKEEDAFVHELYAHVRNYRRGNSVAIDVTTLEARLNEMNALARDIGAALAHQGRFLSVDGDVEVRSLLNLLVGLRMKNFAVVASAYADVPFKFEFENIRAAYVDQERLVRNQKTINSCVSEGTRL